MTLECEQAMAMISARIDGQLRAPADVVAVEAHLAECAGCRALADALESQDARLTRAFAPRRTAAAGVADRVLSELGAQAPPRRRLWPHWLAAAAAGFFVAL